MQQAVQGSTLERNITVSIPVDHLEAEIAQRLKKLARTVKMQGFRPGHVPIKMVERHYGFQVRQEVVTDEVQQRFADAVKDQNYRVAGYPRFQPVQSGEGATSPEAEASRMALAFGGGLVAPRIAVFLLRTRQSHGAKKAPCHIPALASRADFSSAS